MNKVEGYKINTQKSVTFLGTNNKLLKKVNDATYKSIKKIKVLRDKFNYRAKIALLWKLQDSNKSEKRVKSEYWKKKTYFLPWTSPGLGDQSEK